MSLLLYSETLIENMANTRIQNNGREICPYFGRAFTATVPIPQQGACGGNIGQGQWTQKESCLRPCHLRNPRSCNDDIRLPDTLIFNYLPSEIQQPDYRPVQFTVNSRIEIKDVCRATPCEQQCTNCLVPCDDYGRMSGLSVFDQRYV